jgi:hypothetical protein
MSKKGQMGVGNLSGFAIALLVVGIVVVVAFLIMGSFQTTLTKNGEATTAVNTSIGNVNSALKIIITFPGPLFVVAGIIIVVVSSFAFRRREEGRD